MDISDAVELIKSLDPQDKETAQTVIKELDGLANCIQTQLETLGLKYEIEVWFGNQWLYGIGEDEEDLDPDGWGLSKGDWVSSGDLPC